MPAGLAGSASLGKVRAGEGADTACEPHNSLTTGAKASRRSLVRNNPWNTGPLSLTSAAGGETSSGANTGSGTDTQAGPENPRDAETPATATGAGAARAVTAAAGT